MSWLAFPTVVLAGALLVAWTTGAVVYPLWTALIRRQPRAARWTLLVAGVPAFLALALSLAALLPGDPHLGQLFGCHCHLSMPGWTHLCPMHPAETGWLPLPALALLLALVPGRVRVLRDLWSHPRGQGGGLTPTLLDLPAPTAMLVGWRDPSLVVDRGLWHALASHQRSALLAHERAHLTRRDPQVLMALQILGTLAPRRAAVALARAWLDIAELKADAVAARVLGTPELLAETLLQCARLGTRGPVLSWTGGRLEQRVTALLGGSALDATDGPEAGWVDVCLLLLATAGVVAATPWLHHELEHLINLSL